MFKAFRLALGLKSATDAQLQSIGRQGYARLQALAAAKVGMVTQFDGGAVNVFNTLTNRQLRYDCGFQHVTEWHELLERNHDLTLPPRLHSYEDMPRNYRLEGWRVAYPPTCNVKYIDFQYGAVVDLGAITA
jgi:hypothetical protein